MRVVRGSDEPGEDWSRPGDRAQLLVSLLESNQFPVFTVDRPQFDSAVLDGVESDNGIVVAVQVSRGDAPDRPYITVRSAAISDSIVEPELVEFIEREGERLVPSRVARPDGETAPSETAITLNVEGELLDGVLRVDADVWAARVTTRRLTVSGKRRMHITILGRRVPYSDVRLRVIDDIGPYVEGWQSLRRQLTRQAVESAEQTSPDPDEIGLEAHRRLILFSLSDGSLASARHGRRWRPPQSWGSDAFQLWERAVRSHKHLTGQSVDTASAAITEMLSHITSLASTASWFEDPMHREAAIEETLRFAVMGLPVPSQPAQQAWMEVWQARSASLRREPTAERMSRDIHRYETLESKWRLSWEEWIRRRA